MNINHIVFLFFLSGASSILYQIVWQRVLFSYFGCNVESVTIIVSVFMLGLGMGSIFGGKMSLYFKRQLIIVFLILEIIIGTFGILSISIIQSVASYTATLSYPLLILAVYMIIALPTLLMGATLPVLVAYLANKGSPGEVVSHLYFSNTLGSAVFCLLTVLVLFKVAGLKECVLFAAFLNYITVILICWFSFNQKQVME